MTRSSLTAFLISLALLAGCGAPQTTSSSRTATPTGNDAQYSYPDYFTYKDYDQFYRNIEDPYADYDTNRLPRTNDKPGDSALDPRDSYYDDNDDFYYPQYYYY